MSDSMSAQGKTETIAHSIPGGSEAYKNRGGFLARADLEYAGGFVEVEGLRIHYLDYGPR